MTQLRECPFCNEKDELSIMVNNAGGTMYQVRCDNCGIVNAWQFTATKAIEIWNTRAIDKTKFTKGQHLTSMREVYEALLLGHKVQNDEDPGYFYFHEDDGFMSTEGNDKADDHDRMSRNTLGFSNYEYWEILE